MYKFNKKSFLVVISLAAILFSIISCESSHRSQKAKEDPYNGVRRSYREDGSLLAEVTYRDSIRNGLARNYYRNGKIQMEMTYVEGVRQGDAYTYYEDGQLYQITPFVDDKREGIQKRFYPGNILMADIPFKNNDQVPGLKEYSKEGQLLTKEVRLVFNVIDKTAFEDRFDLVVQLSDGSTHAKFDRVLLDDKGGILGMVSLKTDKGKAMESFYISPGRILKQRILVRSERKTRLGNTEIFEGTYNLSLENKKRFH